MDSTKHVIRIVVYDLVGQHMALYEDHHDIAQRKFAAHLESRIPDLVAKIYEACMNLAPAERDEMVKGDILNMYVAEGIGLVQQDFLRNYYTLE